ncbi:MAG: hypothetical protein ACLQVI_04755 [Polyangiaceae bacterium]
MSRSSAAPYVVVALACVALVTFSACASGTRAAGGMEPRYIAVHNALAAMGLAQVGPIQRGSLAEGRETRVPLELAAGCTTVVVLGGDGVRDLDASLVDPAGAPVAHDTTRDSQAVVRACVERAGAYALVVKMAEGGGDYLAATWSGGIDVAGSVGGTAPGVTASASGLAGSCDAPIPITAGTYEGNTARGESENESSCASSQAKEIVYRLELTSRQRATIDVDPHFDSVLYVRKDDCTDVEAEVACNDDVGHERRSRVEQVLEPGTYFVFVDGLPNETGPFRLKVALEDVPTIAEVCRGARPLASGIAVNGATTGGFDSAESTCGQGAKGNDAAFHLDLVSLARVRVTERSSDFSPVVHLRKSCPDESSEIACAEEGMSDDVATHTGILDSGSYTVFADSSGRDGDGHFTLLAETSPVQGAGAPGDTCPDAFPISASAKYDGDTFPSRDDVSGTCGGAGAPDEIYRLDLQKRMRLTTRIARQEGHHVFVLTRTCGDRAGEVACGASIDQVLAPGTYWLAVDGAAAGEFGRYSFEARFHDVTAQETACKGAPVLHPGTVTTGTTDGAGDKFTTSCGGREDTQSNPDRMYRIDLAHRAHIALLLSTPTWDGVLVLRRSCVDPVAAAGVQANEVRCNNDDNGDTHRARIDMVVDPGTYYVLVDGHATGNAGPFTLDYRILK